MLPEPLINWPDNYFKCLQELHQLELGGDLHTDARCLIKVGRHVFGRIPLARCPCPVQTPSPQPCNNPCTTPRTASRLPRRRCGGENRLPLQASRYPPPSPPHRQPAWEAYSLQLSCPAPLRRRECNA